MGLEEIIQAITNVGFPIAVALICFWYIQKLESSHKEETDKLSEAIMNNTLVMQKLLDRLGAYDIGETRD